MFQVHAHKGIMGNYCIQRNHNLTVNPALVWPCQHHSPIAWQKLLWEAAGMLHIAGFGYWKPVWNVGTIYIREWFSNGISWPTLSKTKAGLAERFMSALAEQWEINAIHYHSFTVTVVNMLGLYYCHKISSHSWAHLIETWLCPTHLLPLPASL